MLSLREQEGGGSHAAVLKKFATSSTQTLLILPRTVADANTNQACELLTRMPQVISGQTELRNRVSGVRAEYQDTVAADPGEIEHLA